MKSSPPTFVACPRLAHASRRIPGARNDFCARCLVEVSVSPSSDEATAAGARVLCLQCAFKHHNIEVTPPTAAQLREISAATGRAWTAEEVMQRWRELLTSGTGPC